MKVLYCYEDEGIGTRMCAYMNTVACMGVECHKVWQITEKSLMGFQKSSSLCVQNSLFKSYLDFEQVI